MAAGKRIATFTRVETPGDNAPTGNDDVTWVKVRAAASHTYPTCRNAHSHPDSAAHSTHT